MRALFSEYYSTRTEDEVRQIWKDAYFSFDTNVMLELYLWKGDTRNDWLNVMREVGSERLWLPYQVAREYHADLERVIGSHIREVKDTTTTILDNVKRPAFKQLNAYKYFFSRLPEEFFAKHLEAWENSDRSWKTTVRSEINQSAKNYKSSCELLKRQIAELFEKRIGQPYEQNQLIQWHQIAEARRMNRIPPGYEDSGKTTNKNGDVFLWLELIEQTRTAKRPLIFVTMDTKEDWFIKDIRKENEKRKIVCARPELIEEMNRRAGFDCLIYSADEFLEASNKNLDSEAKAESILEVRDSVDNHTQLELLLAGGAYAKRSLINHFNNKREDQLKQLRSTSALLERANGEALRSYLEKRATTIRDKIQRIDEVILDAKNSEISEWVNPDELESAMESIDGKPDPYVDFDESEFEPNDSEDSES